MCKHSRDGESHSIPQPSPLERGACHVNEGLSKEVHACGAKAVQRAAQSITAVQKRGHTMGSIRSCRMRTNPPTLAAIHLWSWENEHVLAMSINSVVQVCIARHNIATGCNFALR